MVEIVSSSRSKEGRAYFLPPIKYLGSLCLVFLFCNKIHCMCWYYLFIFASSHENQVSGSSLVGLVVRTQSFYHCSLGLILDLGMETETLHQPTIQHSSPAKKKNWGSDNQHRNVINLIISVAMNNESSFVSDLGILYFSPTSMKL